jgi:hypothetical protein
MQSGQAPHYKFIVKCYFHKSLVSKKLLKIIVL